MSDKRQLREKKSQSNHLGEIASAIETVGGWGSVEIYIQDSRITQITTRIIKKTKSLANPT